MADRIVVLNKGIVAQSGHPMDLYHSPDNEFVATFIGSPRMNILPVTLSRPEAGKLRLENADGGFRSCSCDGDASVATGEAKLGIRPEHLRSSRADKVIFRPRSSSSSGWASRPTSRSARRRTRSWCAPRAIFPSGPATAFP